MTDIETYLKENDIKGLKRHLNSLIKDNPTLENHIVVEDIFNENVDIQPTKKIRIAFLRSITFDPMTHYLKANCYLKEIKPEIFMGEFGQFDQYVLDSRSSLFNFDPDLTIIVTRVEDIAPALKDNLIKMSEENISQEIERIINRILTWVKKIKEASKTKIIINSFEIPRFPTFGIIDHHVIKSEKGIIKRINDRLLDEVRSLTDVYVVDIDHALSKVGKENCYDERMWYLTGMPYSNKAVKALSDEYIRFMVPLMGLTKKCIVLDLDNTLWGGILGEEGPLGVKIGPDYPGTPYLQFQKDLLKLYQKGIILAINSKNNEGDVEELFESNSNMILKKEHFASKRINWNNKAQNLKEIAEELNIGIDSMIFIDDNPVERELIKQQYPEVLVPEIPKNPITYSRILNEMDCFEMLSYSKEDMKRGQMYYEQTQRKILEQSANSLEDFYRSLEMVAYIRKDDINSIPRLTKMTQKTNQFNLTTIRYAENDIEEFIKDQESTIYSLKLVDKFGDNGIVGEIIILRKVDVWELNSFILSCRVMGRTVETAFLSLIIEEAKKEGIKELRSKYIPTKKNKPVKDLYLDHNFSLINEMENGTTEWKFIVNDGIDCPEWVNIIYEK